MIPETLEQRFHEAYPWFRPETIRLLAQEGRLLDIPRHDQFIREGRTDQRIAFVIDGLFRGVLLRDGEEQNLWFSSDLDLMASYSSILDGAPSKLRYEALEDSRIFVLEYDRIRELSRTDPALAESLIVLLEKLLSESFGRLERFLLLSPEDRYLQLLEEKPDILDRIPQKLLASYIGITPVSLSRLRSRIAKR